jgi:hypothetical protein
MEQLIQMDRGHFIRTATRIPSTSSHYYEEQFQLLVRV